MSKRRASSRGRDSNGVRIIGGAWRRSRLNVPVSADVRPTGDRIRETLFNWLAPLIEGAVCADLFAGSGVLGLEAASRGAARVTLLETDHRSVRGVREEAARLGAGAPLDCEIEVLEANALGWLDSRSRAVPAGTAAPLDIVFVDPPFGSGLIEPVLDLLARPPLLGASARVYIETAANIQIALPAGLAMERSERAGQVRYHLAAVQAHDALPPW